MPTDRRRGKADNARERPTWPCGSIGQVVELLAALGYSITGTSIQRLVQRGILPRPERVGWYLLGQTAAAYIRYVDAEAAPNGETEDLNAVKLRYWQARADNEELAAEATARMTILQADAEATQTAAFALFRARLDGIPARLAAELAGIANEAKIRKRLMAELREAYGAAASALARLGDRQPAARDRADDEPAPEPDGGGVGGT